MPKQFILEIHTMDKTILKDSVDSITIPAIDGELTVLHNHLPLISALKTGEIKYRNYQGEFYLFISSGFVEVQNRRAVILADLVERPEEIDEKAVEDAKRKAEEALAKKEIDERAISSANADLKLSLSRLNFIKLRKKH